MHVCVYMYMHVHTYMIHDCLIGTIDCNVAWSKMRLFVRRTVFCFVQDVLSEIKILKRKGKKSCVLVLCAEETVPAMYET